MSTDDEQVVPIVEETDVVRARQVGRKRAEEVGLSGTDLTLVATAISEVARNILRYAGHGEIVVSATSEGGHLGLLVVARDEGPGIEDLESALTDGFTTGNGLGLGLPG